MNFVKVLKVLFVLITLLLAFNNAIELHLFLFTVPLLFMLVDKGVPVGGGTDSTNAQPMNPWGYSQ